MHQTRSSEILSALKEYTWFRAENSSLLPVHRTAKRHAHVKRVLYFLCSAEGRSAAKTYDCKFIEVSAAIDHKVDDLLVGILKQIRLIKERNESAARGKHKHRPKIRPRFDETCCLLRAKQNVLGRLLRGGKYTSRSCDNLYVL